MTTFIIEHSNYRYSVMPFGLKKRRCDIPKMMNKTFEGEINETLEVYVDAMIIKSSEKQLHEGHLTSMLNYVRQYITRLNPENCTFNINARNFFRFYLIERVIEANPENYCIIIKMKVPTMKINLMKLN